MRSRRTKYAAALSHCVIHAQPPPILPPRPPAPKGENIRLIGNRIRRIRREIRLISHLLHYSRRFRPFLPRPRDHERCFPPINLARSIVQSSFRPLDPGKFQPPGQICPDFSFTRVIIRQAFGQLFLPTFLQGFSTLSPFCFFFFCFFFFFFLNRRGSRF